MADEVTTPKDDTQVPAEAGADAQEVKTTPVEASTGADSEPDLRTRVVDVLKQVYDPEIPVDIYELGLIYNVDIDEGGNTAIKMTLTSPMCPVAESLPAEVEQKVGAVKGVRDVRIDLVWEPPWDKDMMSEAAKLKLNLF